jgi:hypothetical protein
MSLTAEQMETFLVQWMNKHAAGTARTVSFQQPSDTSLVLLAFDLKQLAKDLAVFVQENP